MNPPQGGEVGCAGQERIAPESACKGKYSGLLRRCKSLHESACLKGATAQGRGGSPRHQRAHRLKRHQKSTLEALREVAHRQAATTSHLDPLACRRDRAGVFSRTWLKIGLESEGARIESSGESFLKVWKVFQQTLQLSRCS